MKQQRINDLSALATTKIKCWNYPSEVIIYKDIILIALNSSLSDSECLKDLRWALEKIRRYRND